MSKNPLNRGLSWALTQEAKDALRNLVAQGIDYDLAFVMLEDSWPEEDFYEASEVSDED